MCFPVTIGSNIRLGHQDYIELGNLSPKRDWGHAKDYVRAMWLMLQQEIPDDYVVATGESHSVKEFLNDVWEIAQLGNPEKHLKINKKYFRPHEVPYLLGDSSKARKILGWEPKYNLKLLAEDMYMSDFNHLVSQSRSESAVKLKLFKTGTISDCSNSDFCRAIITAPNA